MATKKGGAPRKARGALDQVLFIRVDRKLVTALDRMRSALSVASVSAMSRADVVRKLLWDAVKEAKRDA